MYLSFKESLGLLLVLILPPPAPGHGLRLRQVLGLGLGHGLPLPSQGAPSCFLGSNVPKHGVSMVSAFGAAMMVWGMYSVFGYLDP